MFLNIPVFNSHASFLCQMVTLQENDGDKNDVLRQKRRHEKHFVYDLAFGEDSTQVTDVSPAPMPKLLSNG